MTDTGIQQRGTFPFWNWCGITTLRWMAGWPFAWYISEGPAVGTGGFWVVSLMVSGMAIGLGQQGLLRRTGHGFRFWCLVTSVGVALAVGIAAIATLWYLPILLRILPIPLAGCVPGVAQWLNLKRTFDMGFRSAILVILAWVSAFVTLGIATVLVFFSVMSMDSDGAVPAFVIATLAPGMLLGGLSGLGIRNGIRAQGEA